MSDKNKFTAVIFSAGMARRLYPVTARLPKNLIKIDQNRTILDLQIEALIENSLVDEIVIVVGFEHQQVREYLFNNYPELSITFILNPFYEVSGNIISSWLALREIQGNVITINGDDVFSERIISMLIKDDRDIVLSISKSDTYDEDDMKVCIGSNQSVIEKIGKDIDPKRADAESIGIIKFSQAGIDLFIRTYNQIIEEDNSNIGLFYLSIIQRLIDDGINISFSEFEKDEWREFDFKEDIEAFSHDLSEGIMLGKIFYR